MKHFLVIAALLICGAIKAEEKQITSPDGKILVTISDKNGQHSYSISYNGTPFIHSSPLGLVTNVGDFSRDMSLGQNVRSNKIDETYTLPNIKQSNVHYVATEAVYQFSQQDKVIFDVIFRVSDRDVAFRYKMYPHKKALSCVVKEEMTGFVLPEGSTTFLCPQSKPMGGFARTSPSYETPYKADDSMGKNGWGEGYTFPCLFRNGDKGWILISETGVDSKYCGSRLLGHENGLYTIGFPQEGEMNGNGTTAPGLALPGETPWRTITLGETLAPIVETTVSFDVVKPLYAASGKYEYGRGSWSWIIGMDGSTKYEEQLRYIDFSAAMGYQSVLVDALWDTQIGYDKIEQLAKYGAQKGVGLYLWYNSNGYWNDAPQSPRGIMDNAIARRKEMKWMQSIGIRGIKVDFFGGEPTMNFEVVKQLVEYGRSLEEEHNKKFRFTLTTNGILLNDEILDFANKEMSNIVLSIDGRKEINDLMRPTRNNHGSSYDIIMPKFKKVAESRNQMNYYVRGTFTHNNLDFSEDVLHLADEGFEQISVEPVVAQPTDSYAIREEDLPIIFEQYDKLAKEIIKRKKAGNGFNFFHFMIDLNGGPCVAKRLSGCGSGCEYLAVTPWGDFYPCHQFVGNEEFLMGNVDEGITRNDIRDEFKSCNVYSKEKCKNCFAKFYCSGGCAANSYNFHGNINDAYDVGCEMQKKRIECAIMIRAAMAED